MNKLKRIVSVLITIIMMFTTFSSGLADTTPTQEEQVHAFVERLYVNMMGRPSDASGLNYWSDALISGNLSGKEIADKFYYSDEFVKINSSIDDEEFVEIMYQTLLGRASDASGLSYWCSLLDSGARSRDFIYRSFLDSEEWKTICSDNGISAEFNNIEGYVNRLYMTVFNRAADDSGKAFWTDKLKTGEYQAITVAHRFFFGTEYEASGKSDTEYVKDLYSTLMGREYDEPGLEFWLNRLTNGYLRLSVFNSFATSAEFTNICNSYGVTRGDAIPEKPKHIICIDPGHSAVMPSGNCPMGPGSSVGKPADAIGTHGSASGLMEYELTLNISNQLKTELENRGYEVIMTRTNSTQAYDLVYRAQVANEGADLMVRIHADGLSNTSVTGCSAIIITKNNPWNPQTYTESRSLADNLLNSYIAATGIKNRGVVEEDTMAGNNWSTVPCVLFELGFMTNSAEDLKMADPVFQQSMVKGLADGIDAYYGGN